MKLKQWTLSNLAEAPLATRRGVIIAIIMAIVIIGYWFFIAPQSAKLAKARLQETILKNQLVSIYQNQQMIAQQATLLMTIESEINRQLGDIPTSNDTADLLEAINQAGAIHNLQFKTIDPLPPVDSQFMHQIPFHVIVNGNYHQLAAFINDLANSPYLLTFNNLNITRNNAAADNSEPLELDVIIQSYYMDEASS